MNPVELFPLPESIFKEAVEEFKEYFCHRRWDHKDGIQFRDSKPAERKNVDKSVFSAVINALNNHETELKGMLMNEYGIPHAVYDVIKKCILAAPKKLFNGKRIGCITILKEIIDFMPTSIVLYWVLRQKLEAFKIGKTRGISKKNMKLYKETYTTYYEFLKHNIGKYGPAVNQQHN